MSSPKASILLIEGDPLQRDLIKLGLQRFNYEVWIAPNGQVAFDLLQQNHPDLILLDLLLPEENGLELLKKMKDKSLLNNLPVIVLSALGYLEILKQAVKSGASDFIIKPFDLDSLAERVQAALLSKNKLSDDLSKA